MSFVESLHDVSKEIRQKRGFATDEAKTINFLVQPLFKALGYDPGNPDDATPEYTAAFVGKNKKVDYALRKNGEPIIFVEVKSATKDLAHEHTEQLQLYFSTKLTVRFGILTNGLEYRFYSDLDNQNIMDDAPFLTIDLLHIGGAVASNLFPFAKTAFSIDEAKSHALGLKYRLALRHALQNEFSSPSDALIKLLIKRIRPELKSVTKKVLTEMSPIVNEVWREFVSELSPTVIPSSKPTIATPYGKENTYTADAMKDWGQMVWGAVINPPEIECSEVIQELPVFNEYRYERFEAVFFLTSTCYKGYRNLLFNGELENPSAAGRKAMRSVNSKAKSCNGWSFWKLEDPHTGEARKLNDLYDDKALFQRLLRHS